MKKVLKITSIFLIIIVIYLSTRFTINQLVIKTNNRHLIKLLYIVNINETYIVYYNEGNIYYQEKEYKQAIRLYEKALSKKPPQKKICDIKINLAYSTIQNNNLEYSSLEKLKASLKHNSCLNSKLERKINNLEKELNTTEYELKRKNDLANNNRQDDISTYQNISNYEYYTGKRW